MGSESEAVSAFKILRGVDVDSEATLGQSDPAVSRGFMCRCRTRAELRAQSPTEQQCGPGARCVRHEAVVGRPKYFHQLFGSQCREVRQERSAAAPIGRSDDRLVESTGMVQRLSPGG